MPPEVSAFPKLRKVKSSLDKHNQLIFEARHEIALLEIARDDLKGLAGLTRKKGLDSKIGRKSEEIRSLKAGLSGIVRQHGFATVQYRTSTPHSILHSVPLTHISKNVTSGLRPTERKPLQKLKPCTGSCKGIKKRLTDRISVNPFGAFFNPTKNYLP